MNIYELYEELEEKQQQDNEQRRGRPIRIQEEKIMNCLKNRVVK